MGKRRKDRAELKRDNWRDDDVQDSRDWPRWPCWRIGRLETEGRCVPVPGGRRGALDDVLRRVAAVPQGDQDAGPRLMIEDLDMVMFEDLDDRTMWTQRR